MKPIFFHAAGAVALTFAIAACVPAPDSTPAPVQAPVVVAPAPTPTPTPVAVVPTFENWIDAPQTPGDWSYVSDNASSRSVFADANLRTIFSLTCIRGDRTFRLERAHHEPKNQTLRILTETADRSISAQPLVGARESVIYAQVDSRDPLLDAIALTRGRFAVEAPGTQTLFLPAWGEVTRVIEDCR